MSSANRESPSSVVRALVKIRSSFVLFLIAFGLLITLVGAIVSGEIAGILGVIGISTIIYGLLGELALRAIGYK